MTFLKAATVSAVVGVLLVGFNNCAKNGGTTTGNPLVSIHVDSYDVNAKSTFEPQSLQTLLMCFKRLRFKSADSDENMDLQVGEVSISPSGTDIGSVEVPPGTYTRIEFDLEDKCGSGRSLQVQNANGTFFSADHISIRFDGTFEVTSGDQTLDLNIQAIVSALNQVSANGQVRSQAESAGGSF